MLAHALKKKEIALYIGMKENSVFRFNILKLWVGRIVSHSECKLTKFFIT